MPKKSRILSYKMGEWSRYVRGIGEKVIGHLRLPENIAHVHRIILDDIEKKTGYKDEDLEIVGSVVRGLRYCPPDGTFVLCLDDDGKIKTNNYNLALDIAKKASDTLRSLRFDTGQIYPFEDVVRKLAEANITENDVKYMMKFEESLKKMSPQMLSDIAPKILYGNGSLPRIDLKELEKPKI